MKKLFKWGLPYIPHIIMLIILLFLLQLFYSYLPIFTSFALKILGDYDSTSTLPQWLLDFLYSFKEPLRIILATAAAMVCLQLIRSFMRFSSNFISGLVTQNIARDMKIKLYTHIVDLPFSYHNSVDTGDLIQRCTSDVDTSSNFIASQFPSMLEIIGTVIFGAVQVYAISPTLMLVSIICVPITGITSILYFKYVSNLLNDQESKEARLTTVIQENVNGVRVVKAFQNEKYEFDKMEEANQAYYNSQLRMVGAMSKFWGLLDLLVMLQYSATIITGIYLSKHGILQAPDIVAALLLLNMLVWPMRGLGRVVSNFGKSVVAARRIDEVLAIPVEYEDNGDLTPEIKGEIEYRNVSFAFPDDNKNFIKNVSFKIKPGETVAIVGKTGSGKSTICNILTRLLDYQDGEVLIDGTPLKKIEKKYLRSKVRMILQEPFLFSKSVYDNIAIANPTMPEEEVFNATRIANVHEEIMKFKRGYQTIVGEKGTTLSGGQKQRLAIARVLVSNAPVLIFDDSLSALDTKTDSLIRQALRNRDKNQTMIIITHRTTTAQEADRIIVLNDGMVEAIGTHEELKDSKGLYAELWKIQGELQKEFMEIFEKGDDK